jgi:hypothetical protein
MNPFKLLIFSGMTVCVLALAGCSDTRGPGAKDPGAQRAPQTAEQLRGRIERTQVDR